MTAQVNPQSRDWLIVKDWANRRLDDYRKQLESIRLDPDATTYTRGRCAEIRALLALGDHPTPIATVDAQAPEEQWHE